MAIREFTCPGGHKWTAHDCPGARICPACGEPATRAVKPNHPKKWEDPENLCDADD